MHILADILPSSTTIHVCSRHNHRFMSDWVQNNIHGIAVSVSEDFQSISEGNNNAVFVVNRADDHYMAACQVISRGWPVLIEKPVVPDSISGASLSELAAFRASNIAVSNVFLFTRYINNFAVRISQGMALKSILINWADREEEIRHGEKSHFDPRLKLITDSLPHILAIISRLLVVKMIECRDVRLSRGGAAVSIDYNVNRQVPCSINIKRNHSERVRKIDVQLQNENITLDFSNEPGIIQVNGGAKITADAEWSIALSPLTSMIDTFLTGCISNNLDKRFSLSTAMWNMEVIWITEKLYNKSFHDWIMEHVRSVSAWTSDLEYALTELCWQQKGASEEKVRKCMYEFFELVRSAIANDPLSEHREQLRSQLSQMLSNL